MTHTGVDPLRVRFYSDAMQVHVLHPTGKYSARCRCGWEGGRHKSYMRAMGELQDHKHAKHGGAA